MRRYYGNTQSLDVQPVPNNTPVTYESNEVVYVDSDDWTSDVGVSFDFETHLNTDYVEPYIPEPVQPKKKKSSGLVLTFLIAFFIYGAIQVGSLVIGLRSIGSTLGNKVENPPEVVLVDNEEPNKDTVKYTSSDYSTNIDYYVRRQLSGEKLNLYDTLCVGLTNMTKEINVETMDEDLIYEVYNYVLAEHPEFFYVEGYVYYVHSYPENYISLEPHYTMTRSQKESFTQMIDEQCDEWLGQVSVDTDDYSKVKRLYEILITNVDYELDSPHNQDIISVFVNHKTVCNGYANALMYMCQKIDIECVKITGYGRDERHAWNLVKEDGKYYLVDVTWGNTLYNSDTDEKFINYAYLNVTNKFLDKSHEAEETFDIVPCRDIDNNYFYRENLLFDSVDESKNAFYYLTYQPIVSVRYTDENTYNEAVQRLLKDGEIYQCFDWSFSTDIRYFDDDENYVLNVVRYE